MSFRAIFRELVTSDLSRECPFAPEPGEFEMHLQAIAQDIANLDGVTHVSLAGRAVNITANSMQLKTLKANLKPILQHHFRYVRISSLEAVDG